MGKKHGYAWICLDDLDEPQYATLEDIKNGGRLARYYRGRVGTRLDKTVSNPFLTHTKVTGGKGRLRLMGA